MTICNRCGCLQGEANPHDGKCEPMPPLDQTEDSRTPRERKKDQVFDQLDMAATYPGSNKLNWGEISLNTINEWVKLFPTIPVTDGTPTAEFDIESIQRTIENWWRNCENAP